MDLDEMRVEMESLVEAIEQSLSIVIGTISETSNAGEVLRNLIASEGVVAALGGPNGWRDRIVRKMQLVAALKARAAFPRDAALQSLISSVLKAQDQENLQ